MSDSTRLQRLEAGQLVPYGGDRVTSVPPELAAAFRPGDHLVVVQATGELLRIPADEHDLVDRVVAGAARAFSELAGVSDESISRFYEAFAERLVDDATFGPIAAANAADVEAARARGRATTRLELTAAMRADMVAGLRVWRDLPGGRDRLVDVVEHDGWRVESRRAPLGVVGFVFEGRPNVFADATGVLRSGNTVVFRIGSDALGTARAIVRHALEPALADAGLPPGAVGLVDAASHSAGWALFSDPRLALAVARGSGAAVAQLGAVARQAGVPVSLHGTGGAWVVAGQGADGMRLEHVVMRSLDRKVCNTANVVCVVRERSHDLVPHVVSGVFRAGERRGHPARLHVVRGGEELVPADWFERTVHVLRPDADRREPEADLIEEDALIREWEWDQNPELALVVCESLDHAIELCNRYSPHFVASVVSDDALEQARFWEGVDAPFVGNGFTRWVDGQYALGRPELGLSNWQHGRLLARSGILSGDSVHTIRLRAVQADHDLHR
jgi:glutamate-5-semialdehyde dehydrogenase